MEGAISCLITLNHDLALTNALVKLDAKDIDVISGSETMDELGSKCIIYMHGNADQPADNWILLRSELDEMWENTWKDPAIPGVNSASAHCLAHLQA